MELVLIHRSNESLKDYFENDKVLITKRTSSNLCRMYKKWRETYLFSLQFKNIISKKKIEIDELNHYLEKCKKILKLISEIKERKRKVENKFKELGIKCKEYF